MVVGHAGALFDRLQGQRDEKAAEEGGLLRLEELLVLNGVLELYSYLFESLRADLTQQRSSS
jgi:hypothetical protein